MHIKCTSLILHFSANHSAREHDVISVEKVAVTSVHKFPVYSVDDNDARFHRNIRAFS